MLPFLSLRQGRPIVAEGPGPSAEPSGQEKDEGDPLVSTETIYPLRRL